jgi:hypothetical protein
MLAHPTGKDGRGAVPAALKSGLRALLLLLLATLGGSAAAIDKTDCDRQILDDSAFSEPIVRDHRDDSFGALANSAVRPLGGGEGYDKIVPRPGLVVKALPGKVTGKLPPPGKVVRTAAELRAALGAATGAPLTIYVDDAAEIDLSFCAKVPKPSGCGDPRSGPAECGDFTLAIPANTTLASGRGRAGSRGARLFSRTFTGCPLLEVRGAGVRISGLRIHGPDPSIESDDPIHCNGESVGISIATGDAPQRWGTEIDNNELSAWPNASILIARILGVRVHHNVMRFNRRREHNGTCDHDYGLGYGVVVGPGSANIEANVFDHNRHDIASDGTPGASYTATYNLVLTGAVDHSFDVHGGKDRKDCTNVAGSAFVIPTARPTRSSPTAGSGPSCRAIHRG